MPNFDSVLFDVDGTLLDSAPGIIQTMKDTLNFMGADFEGVDFYQYIGPPIRESFRNFFKTDIEIEEAVSVYRKAFHFRGIHECSVYPGVHEMLGNLKESGLKLHIATCKRTQTIQTALMEQELTGYFDTITGVTFDNTKDSKSDIIRYVIRSKALGKKKILMIGDRKDDMQGAKDNKIPAVGILYGYGKREELEEFNPLFLAETCKQLEDFILL